MLGKQEVLKTQESLKKSLSWTEENDLRLQKAKEIPIESLFTGNLVKKGKVLMGICPFHDEDTPSFVVYPETNTFNCFGCRANGDAIEFYMKSKNCEFKEALEDLSQ
jgi:DNA primase